ncbi:hypothetical protein [Pseudoxanthomonas kaohsiungensis]|uniref:DNA-binding protein n=1 Tax=Pseudoxanthomonas kaohsiungensis TaxID=283923 RepID=A0ABW3LXE6_9GAMM|nr:hypothetical protein [Pseudoxanthomonas kaohsiungensis]KAF1702942.1 hypothetical protein CSC66_09205 [Pseudoxanthomonas kaohsiungensis]
MTQSSSAKKSKAGLKPNEQAILDSLLKERTGTPERVTAELDRVRPALAQMVEAKVPIRDILNRFIRNLDYRVTAAQGRAYMKREFNYPQARQGGGSEDAANTPRVRKAAKKAKVKR